MTVPTITLNSGTTIPQLGFGVFKVDPAETERIVSDALEVGYRHIDTAKAYNNESGVGEAVAASGIDRGDLFITPKLFNSDQGTQSAIDAFDLSLEKLGLDYVDLYLIHWPCPARDRYVDSWKTLAAIHESGRARAIGVSNFLPAHLERLLAETAVVPAANQIELHPYHQQAEVTAFNRAHGIVTEAWSPLAQGKLVDETGIQQLADAHGKSLAQVILRWHIQQGNVVIPKSNRRERMVENFDIFDFELSADEQAAITALERGGRIGSHPDDVN